MSIATATKTRKASPLTEGLLYWSPGSTMVEQRTVKTPRGVVTYARYSWSGSEWHSVARIDKGGKTRRIPGHSRLLGPWNSLTTNFVMGLRPAKGARG
jgi:hypothetical protein